jgi:hypothetical protein
MTHGSRKICSDAKVVTDLLRSPHPEFVRKDLFSAPVHMQTEYKCRCFSHKKIDKQPTGFHLLFHGTSTNCDHY